MTPAISLHQPWASFIALGVKPYETRHWPAPRHYIGRRIAIHASLRKLTKDDLEWWFLTSKRLTFPPLGAVVCTAVLAEVHPAWRVPQDVYGDYSDGRYAWELRDVEPIEPAVPARGRQGFWNWDASLPDTVQTQGRML